MQFLGFPVCQFAHFLVLRSELEFSCSEGVMIGSPEGLMNDFLEVGSCVVGFSHWAGPPIIGLMALKLLVVTWEFELLSWESCR